jgi:transcriptional regulator with XRE-family HTH domain
MAKVTTKSKNYKRLDGFALGREREELGLTQREFAEKAGWTRQYQSKLENGRRDIWTETANTIKFVLKNEKAHR